MAAQRLGVVAAGHPLSAEAGAIVLREGGNAVDAALGAMLASCVCEPLLTGLGAGGYMLVAHPGGAPVLLDFFVEAPGRGADAATRGELVPVEVSFGDAIQVFNIGPRPSAATAWRRGSAMRRHALARFRWSIWLGRPRGCARTGVELNRQQAYIAEILAGIVTSTPESSALFAPGGTLLRAGERIYQPELADTLEHLAAHGAAPFYTGTIGAAISEWVCERGGMLTGDDLGAYRVIDREPIRVPYRGREVLTNPPPSAGGILIARALCMLGSAPGPPASSRSSPRCSEPRRSARPNSWPGSTIPDSRQRFLPGSGRLGSTTHIAVLDDDGWACSVTCSNGSASGVIVPGTGMHLNNMLGEQDLNPLGFHRYPPGRRLPSMMAPTIVLRDGAPRLVLGSAGSNRIRSAILQTIIRVIDDGLQRPRCREGAARALRGRRRLPRARRRGGRAGAGRSAAGRFSRPQLVLRRRSGGRTGCRWRPVRCRGSAPGRGRGRRVRGGSATIGR